MMSIVKNEKIMKLQYDAQGFRNAFYVLANSIFNKPECENWSQQGDPMSVLGTNGCFAIELYLKFLMVIDSFDNQTLSGKHVFGHKLGKLYDSLKEQNNDLISELEDKYTLIKHKHQYNTLKDFLHSISNHFTDWRYCYEKGALNVNLNTLSDVLNLMEEITQSKYKPISKELAKQFSTSDNQQSMGIDNIDEIARE